ncbi:MAG TPA: M48 family metallopeptidase [Candidatus Angelobacter sp.]|jgi:STE24 endopeptidase|nr:M48 family metallopeptidase [Candidatus Angelobacter sp.]
MTITETHLHPDTPETRDYNRQRRWLELGDLVVSFGFLIALLATGWTKTLSGLATRMGRDHYALDLFFYVMFLSVISKALGFALDFYGFRLEHRFNLSNQRLFSWFKDELKGWLLGLVMATLLAEIVYALIRTSPQYWWIICWLVFIGLFVFFAQIAPVVLFPLFYKFSPLQNDELKARLMRLGERSGTRVRGIYEWKLSEKSKKANAALTGLGNTRRIILADTLLQNYSNDEIEAVLAHELGHHVHGHMLKMIAVQAVVTLAGFWAANEVLRYAIDEQQMFQHLADFANLPLLALVASGLSLLLMPALNAYSRFTERQADLYCWKCVADVTPYISAMEKLARQNLSESHPSRLVELLFHSHPPISKRIAAAEAWAKSHRPSLAT